MKKSIFVLLLFLFSSCISLKKNIEPVDLNKYILLHIDGLVSYSKEPFRVHSILKFRDYLTMVNTVRGYPVVSNHEGLKMKWQCVLNEHPDTSIVMPLPSLPKTYMSQVVVDARIDTVETDYIPTFYFSPVFETKDKGVYAFHESWAGTMRIDMGGGDIWVVEDVIIREFVRFRIVEGTVEWLDCCGHSNDPFGLGPGD